MTVMNNPTTTAEWQRLGTIRSEYNDIRLNQLFADNPNRFQQFSIDCHDLFIDYSKNFIDERVMAALLKLAQTTIFQFRPTETEMSHSVLSTPLNSFPQKEVIGCTMSKCIV